MPLDTSSYYPSTPGSSCDPDYKPESAPRPEQHPSPAPGSEPDTRLKPVDAVAHILSWGLVPLLMPLYGTLLIFGLSLLSYAATSTKWSVSLIIAGITIAIPMLLVVLLKRIGVVHDLGLNERKERAVPYIITILSMAGAGWFMLVKHAPEWIGMFYMGGAAAAAVCLLINFFWKISAHAAGIAGIVALLVRISSEDIPHPGLMAWLVVWILLAGFMGGARVWLGRHTVWQVLAGYAVGYTSVILMTLI
ncbi:MAG: hypothetical protein K2O24_07900 [Muribaculaceae bacterium]|nr:hypothetical protein [Muribaculaceae bacterium]